jgi:hypothetical protein
LMRFDASTLTLSFGIVLDFSPSMLFKCNKKTAARKDFHHHK